MCLGIPGRIVDIISEDLKLATVELGGVRRTANIAFVVDEGHPAAACLDAWVLVHCGFAMQRIDENDALATLTLLRELGELQTDLETRHMLETHAMAEFRRALVRQAH